MKTLDIDEAALMLKVAPDTVRKMAARGEIPATKVGKAWVFPEVLLEEWLLARARLNVKRE
jgi:excisionase family DNA binding protein